MRTFGNGNKGRSGPNAGKGRPEGNRFSGGRKPSPAGDGTGFSKRAGSGRNEGDANHPRSYGGGNSGRGEDRPYNRSYSKPYEKGSRPFPKSDNPGETNSESGDRPYRGRNEGSSGDSSNLALGVDQREHREIHMKEHMVVVRKDHQPIQEIAHTKDQKDLQEIHMKGLIVVVRKDRQPIQEIVHTKDQKDPQEIHMKGHIVVVQKDRQPIQEIVHTKDQKGLQQIHMKGHIVVVQKELKAIHRNALLVE